MPEEIKALRFDIEQIGKYVKGSKKRFTWNFSLNGRSHVIVVDFSFISGKVKLVVDRKNILENQIPANVTFQHPFTLDGFALNILQQGQTFQLRINNKVFSHLYNQVKTNTEFKQYEEEVKDIRVNESNFRNTDKTVKLSIGALGGMKKKPKGTMESENWGNLGGGSSGFPNYFGDSPSMGVKKEQQPKVQASLLDQDEESENKVSSILKQSKETATFFQSDDSSAEKPSGNQSQDIDFFGVENSAVVYGTENSTAKFGTKSQKSQEEQFNTMQNFFATMNLNQEKLVTGMHSQPPPQNSTLDLFEEAGQNSQSQKYPQLPDPVSGSQLQDFNTMQQLFATNMQNVMMSKQSPSRSQDSEIQSQGSSRANEFNTMQNLFATSGISFGPGNAQLYSQSKVQSQKTSKTDGESQSVSIEDFNTMQNLFKTNNLVKSTPVGQRSEDPFSVLSSFQKSSGPAMMSTYSGSKAGNQNINMSNFETMQQGKLGQDLDPLELSQPSSQFSFAKKKQAPTEDLI